jgi:uncharacterized protein
MPHISLKLLLHVGCCILASLCMASATDAWNVPGSPNVIAQDFPFNNGNVHLAGTLYLPATGDHLPTVVVLHDASVPARDAVLYRHLREGLPAMGIAVLLYDRRGSGGSSGSLQDSDYASLASDAVAGQRALTAISRIDPNKVGFWGLSQGGWLALLAAGSSPYPAFAIVVSAPLVTPERQMQFATSNLLTIRGYSQSAVRDMLAARKAWADYMHGTTTRESAAAALQYAETQPWFQLSFLPKATELPPYRENNSWSRKMDTDPVVAVRKLNVPLLFLYGGADPWVPVAQSVDQVRILADERPKIAYEVVAGAGHEMMFRTQENMDFDAKSMSEAFPQAPQYFMVLASWLGRVVSP